jgi:hypothetical protein
VYFDRRPTERLKSLSFFSSPFQSGHAIQICSSWLHVPEPREDCCTSATQCKVEK